MGVRRSGWTREFEYILIKDYISSVSCYFEFDKIQEIRCIQASF